MEGRLEQRKSYGGFEGKQDGEDDKVEHLKPPKVTRKRSHDEDAEDKPAIRRQKTQETDEESEEKKDNEKDGTRNTRKNFSDIERQKTKDEVPSEEEESEDEEKQEGGKDQKDYLKKKVSVNRRQKTKEEVPSEEEDEEEGETEEESDDESFDEEGTSFKSGNGIKQFSSLMHIWMKTVVEVQPIEKMKGKPSK